MSLIDSARSTFDSARRRLAESEEAVRHAASEAVEGAKRAVRSVSRETEERAHAAADEAVRRMENSAAHAKDLVDAAAHAAKRAAAKVGASSADDARAQVAPAPRVSTKPADDVRSYTDDALEHSIRATRLRLQGMAPGPARDAAQAQLTSMEREARARAERPDNAATPEAQRPSAGEYLRAPTAFLAGVGTGLVSGFLGPGGVAAQAVLDQKVDANATPSEKFAFGLGQELAGAFHMVEGMEKVAAGGVAEGATAGVATPIAAPVAIVGAAEAAAGAGLAAGGAALASRGAAPTAPAPARSRTPSGIDDKHILNGEVKYSANGTARAQGFHHEGPNAGRTARVVAGTKTKPNAQGVYKAEVEVRDPKTGAWVRKPRGSTFFPKEWDRSQVRKAIREAYANRRELGRGRWMGRSAEGMLIEGYADAEGRILTAFPEM